MIKIHTKNFRIQVWLKAIPDRILLGTISICAGHLEGALRVARENIELRPIGEDNFSWEINPDLPRQLFVEEARATYNY